jgi:hypothetical protein
VWVRKTFAIRKQWFAKSYPGTGSAVSERLIKAENPSK